jgi:hypothetical protein
MAEVTGHRIAALQRAIADALNQTSSASTLSHSAQTALLGSCCEQACGLFTDWLATAKPALELDGNVSLGRLIPDLAQFDQLVDAMIRGALEQARDRFCMQVDMAQVAATRRAIGKAIRRGRTRDLFDGAMASMEALTEQACRLARELRSSSQRKGMRRRARRLLKDVAIAALPAIFVGMTAVTPAAAAQNFPAWFGADVAKVVAVQHIAHSVDPFLSVWASPQRPGLG